MTNDALSSTAFKSAIIDRIEHPTKRVNKAMKAKSILPQVVAVIDSLMTMLPAKVKVPTVHPITISLKQKQLNAYQQFFPPGTLGRKLPPSDKSKPPDYNYTLVII